MSSRNARATKSRNATPTTSQSSSWTAHYSVDALTRERWRAVSLSAAFAMTTDALALALTHAMPEHMIIVEGHAHTLMD